MTDLASLFSLKGRVALVTGSSSGIGFGMARGLAAAGAHVVLNGRRRDLLERSAAEIAGTGGSAGTAAFDVTDRSACADAIAELTERHGRLDILIANAGHALRKPVMETGDDDWAGIIDLDLTSCFTLAREAARPMITRGQGRIIFTSSIVATTTRPGLVAYSSAKGGVNALARVLAVELGPRGITCNAIAPGYCRTDGTGPIHDNVEFRSMIEARTPVGRWAEPADFAGAAVFLASDAAAYVNGAVLTVDGGMTAAI